MKPNVHFYIVYPGGADAFATTEDHTPELIERIQNGKPIWIKPHDKNDCFRLFYFNPTCLRVSPIKPTEKFAAGLSVGAPTFNAVKPIIPFPKQEPQQ